MQNQSVDIKKFKLDLPSITIIGRTNVGKSSLFNRIVQSRVSIVQSEKGTTRDRVSAKAQWGAKNFNMIDTGGYTWSSEADFGKEINQEIKKGIEAADILLFVCDGAGGLHPQDELI